MLPFWRLRSVATTTATATESEGSPLSEQFLETSTIEADH